MIFCGGAIGELQRYEWRNGRLLARGDVTTLWAWKLGLQSRMKIALSIYQQRECRRFGRWYDCSRAPQAHPARRVPLRARQSSVTAKAGRAKAYPHGKAFTFCLRASSSSPQLPPCRPASSSSEPGYPARREDHEWLKYANPFKTPHAQSIREGASPSV